MTEEERTIGGVDPSLIRFAATVRPGVARLTGRSAEDVADLDLDRMPDRDGQARFLLSAEGVRRLVDLGFEVTVQQAHPVAPLDASLVMTDDAAQTWLDAQLANVAREAGA